MGSINVSLVLVAIDEKSQHCAIIQILDHFRLEAVQRIARCLEFDRKIWAYGRKGDFLCRRQRIPPFQPNPIPVPEKAGGMMTTSPLAVRSIRKSRLAWQKA